MKHLLSAVALLLAFQVMPATAAKSHDKAKSKAIECPMKTAFIAAAKKLEPNAKLYEVTGPELKAFLDAMNSEPPVSYFKSDAMTVLDKGDGQDLATLMMDGCRGMVIRVHREIFDRWLGTASGI